MFYEPSHCQDPLAILLAREGEQDEVDALEACYLSGRYRKATMEVENLRADLLGASPEEVRAPRSHLYERD